MGLGPSTQGGRVRYLSASQLEKFDAAVFGGCERRWWFRHVAGVVERQTGSQTLGEQVHAQVEHYLKTGEDVLGEVARAGRRFLPRPGPGLLVEVGFGKLLGDDVSSPLVSAGVPFVGRIDLVHRRGEWVTDAGVVVLEPSACEVVDWKTTRQIDDLVDEVTGQVTRRGYAKTAQAIAGTWQMVSYAELARMLWPEVDAVRVGHGYFQTSLPRAASKRSALVPVAVVEERWAGAEALVERIKSAAGEADVRNLTANYAACSAYGGCPHRDRCPRDPKAVLSEMVGKQQAREVLGKVIAPMSLMDKYKKTKAAAAETATATAPAKPADKPAPSPADVAAEREKLLAEERAGGVAPPDQPAPKDVAEPLPAGVSAPEPAGPCPNGGATVETSDKSYACVCGAELKVKPQDMGGKKFALVPEHVEGEAPAAAPKAPKKPKAEKPTFEEKRGAEKSAESGLVLWLDASEDDVASERLETYAARLADELAATEGAADVRCAPDKGSLSFGKWRGALAALARSAPPTGVWAVSSSDELGMVVFSALATMSPRPRVIRCAK